MIKIITDYGFCFGVKKAISTLGNASREGKNVYLTHPLLHNIPENRALMEESHAKFLSSDTKLNRDDVIVLSAHGHTLEEENSLKKEASLIDATCPLILARYRQVPKQETDISYLYLGKKNHQETLGFLSHFPYFHLIDSTLDLMDQMKDYPLKGKSVLIPQTTVSKTKYETLRKYLQEHSTLLFTLDICPLYGARNRQAREAVKDLDPRKSYFIVCGDQASSNAKEIYSSIKETNPDLDGTIALDISSLHLDQLKGRDIYIASATSVRSSTVEKLKEDLKAYFPEA